MFLFRVPKYLGQIAFAFQYIGIFHYRFERYLAIRNNDHVDDVRVIKIAKQVRKNRYYL